jgi:hypothetical protein
LLWGFFAVKMRVTICSGIKIHLCFFRGIYRVIYRVGKKITSVFSCYFSINVTTMRYGTHVDTRKNGLIILGNHV